MKLSIVIVNYNVKYFLEQCLHSIEHATKGIETEVIIVDNASEDGSVEYLSTRFPNVKWIVCKENGGFSHGNNIGFGHATGEYILMLNPDTIVTRRTMQECIAFMDSHPEAGATGVRMINHDGTFAMESRRGIVTPWVSFCKATGLCKRYSNSRLFGHYYMSYLDKNCINPIEMISGAFMLLRKSTLDKVGVLDEQFFMYWEDSDLSYRILQAGYKNYYLPFPILHYKGESSVKSKLRYRYWLYSSLQIFFKKHFPLYNIITYLPLKFVVVLLKLRIHFTNPLIYGKNWEQRKKQTNKRFLVIGSEQSNNEVREILKVNGIEEGACYFTGNEKELPKGHMSNGISTKEYNYILYDTDSYSYDTIIELLQQTPGNNMRIATYSVKTKQLITTEAVYNLKGKV